MTPGNVQPWKDEPVNRSRFATLVAANSCIVHRTQHKHWFVKLNACRRMTLVSASPYCADSDAYALRSLKRANGIGVYGRSTLVLEWVVRTANTSTLVGVSASGQRSSVYLPVAFIGLATPARTLCTYLKLP